MNERPIRALFVVPHLVAGGGSERHVATLLPRLDPARFTPSLVCIGGEGAHFAEVSAAGVRARALGLGKRQARLILRELVAIMRTERPDVVVVSGRNAEIFGRIAARRAGIAHTVMWVHNATEITRRGVVHRWLDRSLIRWTSAFFGVAEAQRSFMAHDRGYPAEKIRIIHNGVDPSAFRTHTDRSPLREFGLDHCDAVVGILGSLRPEKDHETFLRAARAVVNQSPRVGFLIVGDGECRPRLEALCDELKITANVRFAGMRLDVDRLLRAIDVLAMTSTTECFPMALLEAMASGRPVVCTAVGGVSEIVAHGTTGYLVPAHDPAQVAAQLMRVLADPQEARVMGLAGRDRVQSEFTLDRSVESAQRALAEVVGSQYISRERV
jgi:glycosyltransferase involved in cell wall biosynthesis